MSKKNFFDGSLALPPTLSHSAFPELVVNSFWRFLELLRVWRSAVWAFGPRPGRLGFELDQASAFLGLYPRLSAAALFSNSIASLVLQEQIHFQVQTQIMVTGLDRYYQIYLISSGGLFGQTKADGVLKCPQTSWPYQKRSSCSSRESKSNCKFESWWLTICLNTFQMSNLEDCSAAMLGI